MSRFFSDRYEGLKPYVPGEQPQDMEFVKLNTNESPFPPSPKAIAKAEEAAGRLQRYPDPDIRTLSDRIAERFGVKRDNVIVGNGSDELLNFAFMAFCRENRPAVFPDITYGFYPVFAQVNGLPYRQIPLRDGFRIEIEDYIGIEGTVFIANPNAHTGIALRKDEIQEVVRSNPDDLVVVDEAYVDFGAESCMGLVDRYDNLLVIQTMSKSRSLAGARLGYAIGNRDLITDLNTLRNSTNPYNINAMSMAAAEGVLDDDGYTEKNCRIVAENREYVSEKLTAMGFELTDSKANFIFMRHPEVDGKRIYETMKEKGVLIRHFDKERISQYNRVTIGTREQMDIFLEKLQQIIGE